MANRYLESLLLLLLPIVNEGSGCFISSPLLVLENFEVLEDELFSYPSQHSSIEHSDDICLGYQTPFSPNNSWTWSRGIAEAKLKSVLS